MKNIARALVGMFVVFVLLAAASAARADEDWTFTYTGTTATDNASGILVTTDLVAGQATVLGISGLYNGSAITGLLPPGTCCSSPPNDNILYFPGPAFLDVPGLGFQVGGLDSNIYLSGATPVYSDLTAPSNNVGALTLVSSGNFTVTPAVPEPSSILLTGAGLIGLAALVFRKKVVNVLT